MKNTTPHFIIKNKFQKSKELYENILTREILKDVCKRVTGCTNYTVEFVNDGYNKGRLATIEYRGTITYVSFSDKGRIKARNSFFQSLTTALIQYYKDTKAKKRICFYFLPLVGNVETSYFKFLYRLMATAGVEFLNEGKFLKQKISPFNTVDDVIAARDKNKGRNKSNNSTNLTRSSKGITQIFGKTYGASKKETVLICLAVSRLASQIELYEICEKNLSVLPKPDLEVIQSLGNITIIPTDLTKERNEFEDNDSLRSPRFTDNLLGKFGAKKCAFCECVIPELIEGAHIWPVADIKIAPNLREEKKLEYAIDGDNGIWLCENHHRMLDISFLMINEEGKLKYRSDIEEKPIEYIKGTTLITQLKKDIITTKFVKYLKERNKLVNDMQYNLL